MDFVVYSRVRAMWGFVRSGVLLPAASDLNYIHPRIAWTTVVPGSGGQSAGWDFPHELGLPELHSEVEDALREAVSCFRAELYIAAVVMLGKASEGTWIEMGLALLSALPADDASKRDKLKQDWSGPDVGFARKMREILKLYETRQDLFKAFGASANVRLEELRMAMIWSEALRDARNVVHHNVDPNINPTFEMVSTLFLAALPNLKALHRLMVAAKQ